MGWYGLSHIVVEVRNDQSANNKFLSEIYAGSGLITVKP